MFCQKGGFRMNYGTRIGDTTFAEKYYISNMPVKILNDFILNLTKIKSWIKLGMIYEIETSLTVEKGSAIVQIRVKNGDEDLANSFFCELENQLCYGGTAFINLYLLLEKLHVLFQWENDKK